MALSGSVSTTSYEGRYLTLSWTATQSDTYNKSTVSWTLSANGGSSSWYATGPVTVVINGTTVYSLSASNRYSMYKGTVSSGSLDIAHNDDGTKSFTVSVSAAIYTTSVNCTGSATFTLDTITRYPSISQRLSSKTETSITMEWESNVTCDMVHYSTDNGSTWHNAPDIDASSGSYTISGLSPNTTYNIKTRVRRKGTLYWSESSKTSISTYAYPYANSMPNFNIGDTVTIGVYNPLARPYTLTFIAEDGQEITTDRTYTGTSVSGFAISAYTSIMYASIPNARSGRYSVRINYDTHHETRTGGLYSVTSASAPTVGAVAYLDANSTVTTITGNNQKIIPGKSRITFNASGLTARDSATVSSAKVTVNGTDYAMTVSGSSATVSNVVINSSEQTSVIVTVTDSRGLTGTKTVNLDIVEYQVPTMNATAQRVSGYYSNTEITPTTNYTYIGTNDVTIQLQARKTSESSYSVTQTISSSGTTTVSLDNTFAWYLLFTITDSFGGSSTFEITIGKGIPLFYFDIDKSSVSMDMFPTHSNAFEVSGDIYINGRKITDFVVDEGTDGIWIYRKWNSGVAECWGTTASESKSFSTGVGAGYYAPKFTESYPSGLFISTPHTQLTLYDGGAVLGWVSLATNNKNTVEGYPTALLNVTRNIQINIYAKGEWDAAHFDPASSLPSANGEAF